MKTLQTILVLLAVTFSGTAWAQDDSSDDDLGDIFGSPDLMTATTA